MVVKGVLSRTRFTVDLTMSVAFFLLRVRLFFGTLCTPDDVVSHLCRDDLEIPYTADTFRRLRRKYL